MEGDDGERDSEPVVPAVERSADTNAWLDNLNRASEEGWLWRLPPITEQIAARRRT